MNAARTTTLLLRLYPSAWRSRYGDELEELIRASATGPRLPRRVVLDVAASAARERVRATGLGDGAPSAPVDRARAGALTVLCAWALFVVAGSAVQKFSEHWGHVTTGGERALAHTAFTVLVVTALVTGALVCAGVAAALPSAARLWRHGWGPVVRARIIRAVAISAAAVAGGIVVVAWAHGLPGRQRNGEDAAYAIAFVIWALTLIACLAAWVAAAVAIARRLDLSHGALRLEALLACAATAGMAVMTAATVAWWVAMANAAPWFLAGARVGTRPSPFVPELLAAVALMLAATGLGLVGARQALAARRALRA